MTTTRKLMTQLQKVKPTKSLLFRSMGCEQQAAAIRNKTIDSMNEENIEAVTLRYLQNRQGERNTFREVIFWGMIVGLEFIAILYIKYLLVELIQKNNNYILTLSACLNDKARAEAIDQKIVNFLLLFLFTISSTLIANIPPNISNTLRYRETKNACAEWLRQRLGNQAFQEIEKLSYDRHHVFKVEKPIIQGKTEEIVMSNQDRESSYELKLQPQ